MPTKSEVSSSTDYWLQRYERKGDTKYRKWGGLE